MKSNWVRFLILAVIGFGLGAAFALFQTKNTPVATVSKPAEPEIKQEDLPPGALPLSESVSKAEMMAGTPVGGAFSLTDHNGNVVTEKSWPGKYKLVFFGFTHCPDVCPTALQKITLVMENLDAAGAKLAPLFITVDPERDTQQVMASYVSGYNPHITGLTGTREKIDDVINTYKVFSAKIPAGDEYRKPGHEHMNHDANNYMMDHSAYIYLMSPDDRLLETFGVDETAEGMIGKIKPHLAH